jgi:sugar phosphate isomerase/epimerase
VYVACSTLCFASQPLEQALRLAAEMEFSKVDVAVHEHGPHLRPSQIAADVGTAATRLRLGPGLIPAAFSVTLDAPSTEEYLRQFRAVCRLARVSAVPVVTLPAAPTGTGLDDEVKRLTGLTRIAAAEGVLLDVGTETGTLTEDPDVAVTLCERVPGLGLTLDPSHYLTGPHQGEPFDQVYPYVRHVRLRDSGRGPNQFQVRVGQGEIEYGKIVAQLSRHGYDRLLSVDLHDAPDVGFPMLPEVRKLKYLLESLV